MGKTRKMFNLILFGAVFLLLSILIKPKKGREKIIGFVSARFSGNIKYLYLEMVNYLNVKAFFVTGEKDEIKRVRKLGVDARYYMDVNSAPCF